MAGVPRPSPCFLDKQVLLGARSGKQRWRNQDGSRLYEWDSLHGHIEVYNKRGRHMGVADAVTGMMVSGAVRGRKIDV
ncbi:colicin E3/pyocin S6 family cytotoxin [Sphaerisporangium siamense]|uniref:colicin E3/pyocin S6 family cytotoxin n=1 Tax=Sphaerisporangium siamense TaxID=795645 RepID=UPI00160AA9F6